MQDQASENTTPETKTVENQEETPVIETQTQMHEILTQHHEQELQSLKDQLLRSLADMENLRKRSAKQIEDSSKYAITNFAKDMINVMENLNRATETIPKDLQDNEIVRNIAQGVELVQRELVSIFERNKLVRIFPNIGENFDHNFHQAVAHVPSDDQPAGTIVQTMQSGYTLNDRLLRPAMVAVAKALL